MYELWTKFNVLKMEPQNKQLKQTIPEVKLSLVSDVEISMSQSIENFSVSKRYQFLNGVTKDIKPIRIAGLASDDLAWGRAVQFAISLDPGLSNRFLSVRARIASALEMLFDLEELLTIYDTTIGKRTNCIITNLSQRPSQEYENVTEWTIELAQVRLLTAQQFGDVEPGLTVDPYLYYDYGDFPS